MENKLIWTYILEYLSETKKWWCGLVLLTILFVYQLREMTIKDWCCRVQIHIPYLPPFFSYFFFPFYWWKLSSFPEKNLLWLEDHVLFLASFSTAFLYLNGNIYIYIHDRRIYNVWLLWRMGSLISIGRPRPAVGLYC